MRSHVAACLLGAGVVALLGQTAQPPRGEEWKNDPPIEGAPQISSADLRQLIRERRDAEVRSIGRYQMFMHPISMKGTYLLDTASGRVWSPIEISDGGGKFLYNEWRACPIRDFHEE